MREVEFRRLLDGHNALRVRFEIEQGQILEFVVQLECLFSVSERWMPVVRYDTAHAFAHRDLLHPYKDTVKMAMSIDD